MPASQHDHDVLAQMEARLSIEDPSYLRRFRRAGRATGPLATRHPRVGIGLFLGGLALSVGTLQYNILWPLTGVGLMYVGILLTARVIWRGRGR